MSARTVLMSVFLALAAVGCGGGGSSTQPPSQTLGGAPAPTATPSPSPTQAIGIALGTATQILTPGEFGLNSVPDVQLSTIRQSDGSYLLWAGGSVSTSNGSVALLRTTDFVTYTPVVSSGGNAVPVFAPSAPTPCATDAPGSPNFDANYSAPGTVFPAANGTDLLMIYHGENHTFNGACYKVTPFYATLGLARSSDGGQTWARQGAIISGRDPQPVIAPSLTGGYGAGVPSAIVSGAFIYTFYSDSPVTTPGGDQIMVARAAVASDGAPGSWQKWNNGAFATSGLGGASTALVTTAGTNCVTPRQPGISYNVYLKQYLLTFICGAGWYFVTSPDLSAEVWTAPTQFFVAPFDNNNLQPGNEYDWHFALVTPGQPSGQSTGQTGVVLWARGGYPNNPIHMLWSQSFAISGGGGSSLQRR